MGIGGYLFQDSDWDTDLIKVLRLGIDAGMTLLDTAEAYGKGHSEEVVGKAVKGMRDKVFIATKVSPENLSFSNVLKAAEGSLRRLNTDYIDLYQIHWPNPKIPLDETLEGMKKLKEQGKIRNIGVSNFSLGELEEARILSGDEIVSTQMEYNLFDRSIEEDILPYCERANIALIAYSPLDQGKIAGGKDGTGILDSVAARYGKTPAQVAMNWLLKHSPVVIIPKASTEKHVKENAAASDFDLCETDFNEIARFFHRVPVHVPVERIRVSTEGEGNRKVYQTVEEAVENKLGFVPSPVDLAQSIKNSERLKPVRLVSSKDITGRYDYDLVEGRIRYWAWVIAHEWKVPIPAYIRQI